MIRLDHLAVSCGNLAEGAAHVEAVLGVPLETGGRHDLFGTHNRLLGLDDGLYLEVIAVDPAAAPPRRPRWFDLDRFAGPPRLTNWICRCDDLAACLALAPAGAGTPVALTRGDLKWQMGVPEDGRLPFGGRFPALIAWQGAAHPADRLVRRGVRLAEIVLSDPEPAALTAALARLSRDQRVRVVGGAPGMRARFRTPAGVCWL